MKILLATPSLLPEIGGPAYCVLNIHKYLEEASVKVTSITAKDQGGEYVGFLPGKKFISSFDLVHNFGTWTPFNHFVSAAAYRSGVPQVFCPMGMLEPWSLSQKSFKKRLGWLLYQRKDIERSVVLHATAQLEADNLRAMGVKNPIAVIPHGMHIPAESSLLENKADSGSQRVALFLSRLHPKKGLLELVDAWSQIRPAGWRVVIAGPDQEGYGAVIAESIKTHGLENCFDIVGPVYGEDKATLFKTSDLFVLPTYSENFGLVVPEALAYGLPVITTTGAPWKELQETQSGWWVEPGVKPLVGALAKALSLPPDALREMGLRGRQLVVGKYAWDAVVAQHIELYKWMLSGGVKPKFIV